MKIIQLTDLHIADDPQQTLKNCHCDQQLDKIIQHLNTYPVDYQCALFTGDISHDSNGDAYQRLAKQWAPMQLPSYVIPGNHDDPNTLFRQTVNNNFEYRRHLIFKHWQMFFLNTHVHNEAHGYIDENELLWCENRLRQFHQSAVIIIHHHPLNIGCEWMDAIKLKNANALLNALERHSHCKIILHGHTHQESHLQHQHIEILGTPSSCVQFAENSQHFAIAQQQKPAYRHLELLDNGQFKTHIVHV